MGTAAGATRANPYLSSWAGSDSPRLSGTAIWLCPPLSLNSHPTLQTVLFPFPLPVPPAAAVAVAVTGQTAAEPEPEPEPRPARQAAGPEPEQEPAAEQVEIPVRSEQPFRSQVSRCGSDLNPCAFAIVRSRSPRKEEKEEKDKEKKEVTAVAVNQPTSISGHS